jgi:hypothetical protein
MPSQHSVDWLAWTRTALAVVLAFVILGGGVNLVTGVMSPVTVAVPVDVLPGVAGAVTDGLVAGTALDGDGTIDVVVDDPTAGQVIWSLASWVPAGAIGIATLFLLLYLVRDVRRVGAFNDSTVRRLRTIGLISLIGGPLSMALDAASSAYLARSVLTSASDVLGDITLDWLVTGLGFLALSQVMRIGLEMRRELDEVI